MERPAVGRAGAHRAATVAVYFVSALLAFPLLETIFYGADARHQAYEVFDDLSRLGGISIDWGRFGWTLWTTHLGAGNARLAQFMATPLSIDALMAPLVGPFPAYMLVYFLIILSAGLSMHLFLRRSVGLSRESSLAGGLVYQLGFWNYPYGFSVALAPLVLWLSDQIGQAARSSRRRYIALQGLLAGFLFYNTSSQVAIFLSCLHLAYDQCVAGDGVAGRLSRFKAWLAAWILGFALYAPVVASQIVALPYSVRAIRDESEKIRDVATILWEIVRLYSPAVLSGPVANAVGVPPVLAELGTWWIGSAALLLLVRSLALPRESRRERTLAVLLLIVPVFDLVGKPLLLAAQPHLGILRSLAFRRVDLFFPFLLSANLAIALETVRRFAARGREPIPRWLAVAGSVVCVAQALVCLRMLAYIVRRRGVAGLDESTILAWAVPTIVFLLTAVLLLWAGQSQERLIRMANSLRLRVPTFGRTGSVLLVLLIVERLLNARTDRHLRPRDLASFRAALEPGPALQFLSRNQRPGGGRAILFADRSLPNRIDIPNRMMFAGLDTAEGYQNMYPLRYHRVFGLLIEPTLRRDPRLRHHYETWGQQAYVWGPVNRNVASLLGVRWFYCHGSEPDTTGLLPAFRSGDEVVYENPEALPRAYLAGGVRAYETETDLLQALRVASIGELRSSVFVRRGDGQEVPSRPVSGPPGSVRFLQDDPDRAELLVHANGPSALVLLDNYYPGWEARRNGELVPILPAYLCFRAVLVPAGVSRIEFRFRPRYVVLGWLVMAAAAAVAVALTARGRVGHAPGGSLP